MLRLFLENKEVELSESVQFAITKQFEDVTNPTSIINDWSKTVQIPSTSYNDKLFGHIFNVDRLTAEGDYKLMGIYFDPYKKIDFRLQWGDAIVMTGYAKNISIDKDYYNITLNGELGKVFQEMKKITFDKTSEDVKYIIDGDKYVNEMINKDLVKSLWTSEPEYSDLLPAKGDSDYKLVDYIGFAPNNSYVDNFNYQTYLIDAHTSETFAKELDDHSATTKTDANYGTMVGIAADTVIGEGLYPREIGEYRSYHQLPYIHFNKLFRIFAEKTNEITGYSVDLDEVWFSKFNPYWSKLVLMLKRLFSDTESEEGKDSQSVQLTTYLLTKMGGNWDTFSGGTIINNTNFNKDYSLYQLSFTTNLNVWCYSFYTDLTCGLRNNTGIEIEFLVYNKNNVHVDTKKVLLKSPTSTLNIDNNYDQVYVLPNGKGKVLSIPHFVFNFTSAGVTSIKWRWRFIGGDESRTYFWMGTTANETSDSMHLVSDTAVGFGDIPKYGSIANVTCTFNSVIETFENVLHTNKPFTLNDLWNNEYNLFDIILNYCKMFRIGVFCDYINKKIIFKPLVRYFQDYSIIDWTDKVDYSKDYHIEPITFQNKYVLFNYDGVDTVLNDNYKQKFGVNYGEYKLTTQYEFNTETTNLFEGLHNGICSTDYIKSWSNIYDFQILYTIPLEMMVFNKDKDGRNVDLFGCMYFYNNLAAFDTSSGLRSVCISDDTYLQDVSREYFYSQSVSNVKVQTYPQLNMKSDSNILPFVKPMESYIFPSDYFDGTVGVYDNFWKPYVNERYNIQNKIVTCYINLKPEDYINFAWNKFVRIQNQLYFVNKIYDYTVDVNVPTKVDLITIQDIKGYTDNNYKEFKVFDTDLTIWSPTTDKIVLDEVGASKTLYITSSSPVTWTNPDNQLQSLTIYYNGDQSTATDSSGTIPAGELVPVTFYMNEDYDESGTIVLSNGDTNVNVKVQLIEQDVFTVYRKDHTGKYVEWDSANDYFEFRDVNEEYTLYVTADEPITWEDSESSLQEVFVNGVNGRGSIAIGELVPVKLTIRDLRDAEGYITITNNETEVSVFVRIYVDRTFKVYKSDGTLWTSSDKIDLDNDEPLTQTIYVTSPNTRVKWEVVGNDIQGLGVCVNGDTSDWGDYEFGSGYIPAGTRVPVTFRMEQAGDVQTLLGSVKLSTVQQTTNLDVRLIYWEIFKVFRWDGTLWDEQNDYIRLTNSEPSKIIYLTANSDVEWSDESGELQSLGIYTGEDPGDYYDYDYGSGVIPKPSNMKPIYFRLDPEAWETGSEGNIILFNGRHEWKIPVILAP